MASQKSIRVLFFEIQYASDQRDADNEEFIEKFRQYQGLKNTRDLNVNTELVNPDLRSEFFKFTVSDEAMFSFLVKDSDFLSSSFSNI